MNAGTPIPQYEKAQSIPSGSTYIAEMGDGSGTKGVTQETLTKEVSKGLKIGDIEELQTENKESLVEAINEVANVDILDTKEEVEANTESGKVAGAQALKEMFGAINSNLFCHFGFPDTFNGITDETYGAQGGTIDELISLANTGITLLPANYRCSSYSPNGRNGNWLFLILKTYTTRYNCVLALYVPDAVLYVYDDYSGAGWRMIASP